MPWRMAQHSNTTLHLYKQNFKFSSAHFLIFDDQKAEMLHGHNYRVRVAIDTPESFSSEKDGFFIDFNVFKSFIKTRLDLWDERVLLPQAHKDIKLGQSGEVLEVRFRDRFYAFPKKEVVLLPINNTSVENLSRILAEEFFQEFKKYKIKSVKVYVEETPGQGASTRISAD